MADSIEKKSITFYDCNYPIMIAISPVGSGIE